MTSLRRTFPTITIVLLLLAALWGMGSDSLFWLDWFRDPFSAIWRPHQQLTSTILEVSEAEPIREAGRRLLQPLGTLRLIKRYEEKEKPTPP